MSAGTWDAAEVIEDVIIRDVNVRLSTAEAGTAVLAQVTYQTELTQEDKDHINRVCYGSFLLATADTRD